jgi:hypothetical protein
MSGMRWIRNVWISTAEVVLLVAVWAATVAFMVACVTVWSEP